MGLFVLVVCSSTALAQLELVWKPALLSGGGSGQSLSRGISMKEGSSKWGTLRGPLKWS